MLVTDTTYTLHELFITEHSCREREDVIHSCHFLLNSLPTFVIVHDCLRNDLNTHLLFNKCSPITRIDCSFNVRCVRLESDFQNHGLINFFNYFANNNLSYLANYRWKSELSRWKSRSNTDPIIWNEHRTWSPESRFGVLFQGILETYTCCNNSHKVWSIIFNFGTNIPFYNSLNTFADQKNPIDVYYF